MKLFMYTLIVSSVLTFLIACSESTAEKEVNTEINNSPSNTLIGKWVLINRKNAINKEETFAESPAKLVLKFEGNGYFEMFDRINNVSHRRGYGQWEQKKTALTLTYQNTDTNLVENIEIQTLNDKSLVLKINKPKGYIIDTYKKQ